MAPRRPTLRDRSRCPGVFRNRRKGKTIVATTSEPTWAFDFHFTGKRPTSASPVPTESATLFFDDITIGYRYGINPPTKPPYGLHEVTAEEIIAFGRIWDPRPQHVDREAARRTQFGGLVASGAHAFALWTRLALEAAETSESIAIIAGLGSDFRLAAPIRPGDVLALSAEIVAKRESRSRADAGIMTTLHQLANQNGVVLFENRAVTLVQRR
jgi:acyl dehydratase